MISFSIYMSIFFSLCTIDSSINHHHLSHPHLIVSSYTLASDEHWFVHLLIAIMTNNTVRTAGSAPVNSVDE